MSWEYCNPMRFKGNTTPPPAALAESPSPERLLASGRDKPHLAQLAWPNVCQDAASASKKINNSAETATIIQEVFATRESPASK